MWKSLIMIINNKKKLVSITIKNIVASLLLTIPFIFLYFVLKEIFTFAKNSITPRADWIWLQTILMISSYFIAITYYSFVVRDTYIDAFALFKDSRIRLGEYLKNLPLGFFKKVDPGSVITNLVDNMSSVEDGVCHLWAEIINTIFIPVFTLCLLFFIQPFLAGILLITVAVAFLFLLLLYSRIHSLGKKQISELTDVVSRVLEYISGIKILKAFNSTGTRFTRLEGMLKQHSATSLNREKIAIFALIIFTALIELGFLALILTSTFLVIERKFELAQWAIVLFLGYRFCQPLSEFATYTIVLRYILLTADKVGSAFTPKPMSDGLQCELLNSFTVEFKNVSFQYNQKMVLNNISFTIPEKKITALVGPSGAGKTTITSLIARFWDIDSGEILLSGKNIKELKLEQLIANIAIVFQDVYLFNDTILNNIRIGSVNASREQIIEAAKLARCHEFIIKQSSGYDTVIGEGGCNLSGGEKQRLSIARAILKDAPIILLDEATVSLDPENENLIQDAISQLVKSKTILIIAHHLATIARADQILVLKNGKIIERGSHTELLDNKNFYNKLWLEQQQSKGWKILNK